VVVFDRDDRLQDRYLQRRTRRRLDPPRSHIPGSADFVEAVRLGLGWGMIADQQLTSYAHRQGEFVDLDPANSLDVRLFWQQWRLHSVALQQVAAAVRSAAAESLS
jgi:LysR family transcriptional regulator (chromosome initiation inhibitor)